jgi:translation initiation factor 1
MLKFRFSVLKLFMPGDKTRLVYSTEQEVSKKAKTVSRDPRQTGAQAEQKVRVRLDRKGRGGKSVTIVEGLRISSQDRESLLKQLKTRLGTGGSVQDDVLEIQGDHCDAVMASLQQSGYKPKRIGG